MKIKKLIDRDKKTRSFDGLCGIGRGKTLGKFAATSLNDMRNAGRLAAQDLLTKYISIK